MGLLINGTWQTGQLKTDDSGHFKRQQQHYRNWITADGQAGPSGSGGFRAESDRYHLYVSFACPWAHRTLIVRALKGLEAHLPLSVVHWLSGENGWNFAAGPGVVADPAIAAENLYQLYQKSDATFTGRVTVPVLWDRKTQTIVNNESSDIIRILNAAFDQLGALPGNYYPEKLQQEIDEINARIYSTVNNGVYKAGFATTQDAYDSAVHPLFDTLDWLERRLGEQRFLAGDRISEADIRLFTTLIRFDAVYAGHFKCNLRRLIDYPNLWAFTRQLFQHPKIRPTVNFEHIKKHYYGSHLNVNPTRIVPAGPIIDYEAPHDRGELS